MKKSNKRVNKITSFVIILILFFIQFSPLSASAASFEVPDSLINNYVSVINDPNVINSADSDVGGTSGKQQAPKVDVKFSAQGAIRSGVVVSAMATPSFFNNSSDPSELYFTWYLKKSGCELTNSKYPNGTKIEDGKTVKIDKDSDNSKITSCDKDQDGIITVNDWKITASKIIISSNFDTTSNEVDYSKKIDNKMSAYEAFPEISENNWRKGFLENGNGEIYEENESDAENCYVKEPNSGLMYELRNVESSFNNSCPNGYHRACVAKKDAKCNILNPDFSCSDAINATPPQAYNVPKGIIDTVNSPSKSLFSACAISSEEYGNNKANDFCDVVDFKNFKAGVSCENEEVSICTKDDNTNLELKDANANTIGVIVNDNQICDTIAKPDNTCPEVNSDVKIFLPGTVLANLFYTTDQENCQTIRNGLVDGIKDDLGNVLVLGNKDLAPKCEFKKANNLCKHLFPILPSSVKKDNGDKAISGDGDFNIKEKEFWGADPNKASTKDGGKDEEKVVGLGVDKFEWIYNTGDEVGVVVEGDSVFSTEHADSKFKRMWAFSKNKCDAIDDIDGSDKKNRGFYLEGDGKMKQGFFTTSVDLNECLEENLLIPDDNGLNSFKLDLSSNPQNPTNDPEGNGDVLSISSASLNVEDLNGLLYQWSVQKSKNGSIPPTEETSWLDITDKLISEGSFSDVDRQGLNKSKFDIKLNIRDIEDGMVPESFKGVFYLRIKLKVKGSAIDGSQNAEGFIDVRVKQQENKISVYPVTADESGMLSLNKGISEQSTELCANVDEKTGRCYVSKNQIVGLEVANSDTQKLLNFSWKVNGIPMTCSENFSKSCEPLGNKLFLPILGNEGEAIEVVATAIDSKNESVEIRKNFLILPQGLRIISPESVNSCSMQCLDSNNICPKYLGHYNKLTGEKIPDCSSEVWEAKEGSTVTLEANVETGIEWAIDGQIIPDYQDKNKIQLVIDKKSGANYNVGVTTRISPEILDLKNNLRKALYKNWGIPPEDSIEEEQNASIQINVVEGDMQTLASLKQSSFAASLITHLPQQLVFLFKIFLTAATLLISMSLLFAIIPNTAFREEE